MDQQKSASIQREIIDFVNEYGAMDRSLSNAKRFIAENGAMSPIVRNWLIQFNDCESVVDFMMRYSMDDEPIERAMPSKTIDRIFFEERSGVKFYVLFDKIVSAEYAPGIIERLHIFTATGHCVLQNGCKIPLEEYIPARDIKSITFRYADGTSETPYLPGHINLKDLYRIISKE